MRTTVTLDPDVQLLVKRETRRTGKSFKEVMNESLRAALRPRSDDPPELMLPRRLGLRAGFDLRRLAEVADELDTERYLTRATKPRRRA